jgi:hypothetical protein
MTARALADKYAANIKSCMQNRAAVNTYIAQLEGSGGHAQTGTSTTQAGSFPYYRQGHVVYIPAGMTLPVAITTSLSSATTRTGDPVEARLAEEVNLGGSVLPAGSVLLGQVTQSLPGARMSQSGQLGFKFTTLRLPDGSQAPITAHIVGGLDKYHEKIAGSDTYQGEGTIKKVEQAAIRGGIGAGVGAIAGTAIGGIASYHGYGAGRGAVAGTVIGSALGVADSLMLRKGSDVNVPAGQTLRLQLDAPAQLSMASM